MLTGVSRQRRAANERERKRIQGVNSAFMELKSKLPVLEPEEVSKIETLRLASKWIAHLTTVLIQDDERRQFCGASPDGFITNEIRDKLVELLTFEIEDFDVIDNSGMTSTTHTTTTTTTTMVVPGAPSYPFDTPYPGSPNSPAYSYSSEHSTGSSCNDVFSFPGKYQKGV